MLKCIIVFKCQLSLTCLLLGKLEKGAVSKAICAGFEETTEPSVCLNGGMLFLSNSKVEWNDYKLVTDTL